MNQNYFKTSLAHLCIGIMLVMFSYSVSAQRTDAKPFVNKSEINQNSSELKLPGNSYENLKLQESCDQIILSNNQEGGIGPLQIIIVANDLIVQKESTFVLNSIEFNAIVEQDILFNDLQLYVYTDSDKGPGEEIYSLSNVQISDVEYIGDDGDMDFITVKVDLPEEIELYGENEDTTYWIGIMADYPGNISYMETTTNFDTQEVYYYDSESGWFSNSEGGLGEPADGVISFFGNCEALPACDGTPEIGEIAGDSEFGICEGFAFSLEIEEYTHVADLNFQWQMKTADSNDWQDIEGANTSKLTLEDGITEATDFRLSVECANSGEVAVTSPVSVTMNPALECYCQPVLNCADFGDFIASINFPGEDNTSIYIEDKTCAGNGYEDYSDMSVTLSQEESYEFEISTGSEETNNLAVWIDFNDDGVFSDDEKVGYLNEISNMGKTAEISIPQGASIGKHRMRMFMGYSGDAANPNQYDPCNEGEDPILWGEILDFSVEIVENLDVDLNAFNQFSFYPNPVENQLVLTAQAPIEKVSIVNLLGQSIQSFAPNASEYTMNVESLEAGIYFIEVHISGAKKSFKMIKK